MKESMTVTRLGSASVSPRVSVIIPTYKPGDYIWKCLDSLRAQTMPEEEWEIILILNGCDEPYRTEISDYISSRLERFDVTLIHTPCGGVSNARNLGLDVARGEYVTFVDDDDYVSPRYLQSLMADADGCDMVLSDALSFVDGMDGEFNQGYVVHKAYMCIEKMQQDVHDHYVDPVLARKYYNISVAKLLRRGCVGQTRFNTDFRNGEDSIFMFALSGRIRRTAISSPDAVYYRRLREGSAWMRRRPPFEVISTGIAQMRTISLIFKDSGGKIQTKFWLQRLAGIAKDTLRHLLK